MRRLLATPSLEIGATMHCSESKRKNMSLLHFAVQQLRAVDVDIVKLLLEQSEVDVNFKNNGIFVFFLFVVFLLEKNYVIFWFSFFFVNDFPYFTLF